MSFAGRGPAYCIHTERTIIRCWNPSDAKLLQDSINASLDHLRPWMAWTLNEPEEISAKAKRLRLFRGRFDLDQGYVYGIFNPEETKVLGGTGLHPRNGPGSLEIGYWIHVDYINQGLATEISAALTKVAFEINQVDRVEIHCNPKNVRSAAVPKKLGFSHEATLRERIPESDGTYSDEMIWTLFRTDFAESLAANCKITAFDALGQQLL